MTKEKDQSKEKYRWQLTQKNGASVSFDVDDGDKVDKCIKKWIKAMTDSNNSSYYDWLHVHYNETDVWLDPNEFSMGCRSLRARFDQMTQAPMPPEQFKPID